MPKASIIITCYNLGAYLEEALDSALNQTYSDFEVLLVDDGSTDPQTIALLDRLPHHPRLQILRTANKGVARARNRGISNTISDYILPLDADDRILPGYLARAVSILDQQLDAGFVGCHYRAFGEYDAEYRPDGYTLAALLIENTVPIASLFRRSCWEQVGGYSPEITIEDWDLWLSILEHGYLGVVIPEVLFEYRVRVHSRNVENQQPQTYQHARAMLYDRHSTSYERYARHVILEQVKLHSMTQEYQDWLKTQTVNLQNALNEQQQFIADLQTQTVNLQNALNEQQQLIVALQTIADARADWITQLEAARDYHAQQSNQWQQVAEQHTIALEQEQRYWRQMPWHKRLKWCLSGGKLWPRSNQTDQ
jgi:glycosyltransferase involved in cell wall biosynthesis